MFATKILSAVNVNGTRTALKLPPKFMQALAKSVGRTSTTIASKLILLGDLGATTLTKTILMTVTTMLDVKI